MCSGLSHGFPFEMVQIRDRPKPDQDLNLCSGLSCVNPGCYVGPSLGRSVLVVVKELLLLLKGCSGCMVSELADLSSRDAYLRCHLREPAPE